VQLETRDATKVLIAGEERVVALDGMSGYDGVRKRNCGAYTVELGKQSTRKREGRLSAVDE
jgi:hypothetical protein